MGGKKKAEITPTLLERIRILSEFSEQELAEMAGIDRTAWYHKENARQTMAGDDFARLLLTLAKRMPRKKYEKLLSAIFID